MNSDLSPKSAALLFAVVILAWGANWSVTQVLVQSVPPLWTTGIRCWIAVLVLLPALWLRGLLILPPRGDVPVILSISILHMVAFSTLAAAGQQFVPASKAIVLGYTTPIWVAVAAPYFLDESITRWKIVGIILSLSGLVFIFKPGSFNWSDRDTVIGCGLIMLAAGCWAASIVYVRSHQWIARPIQLLLWQVLLAAIILSTAGIAIEGFPAIIWSTKLVVLFLFGGVVGTVLAYWAMSIVNQRLPAITTSLGVLATPLVGIACAALTLGEQVDASLLFAAVLIVGGVAIGTVADIRRKKKTAI